MSQPTQADLKYKADRAAALLDDSVLAEAFDAIEAHHISAMLNPTATDDQRREHAQRVNAVRFVRDDLRNRVLAVNAQPNEPVRRVP